MTKTQEKTMEWEKGDVYKAYYAWEKIGDKLLCAWCKKDFSKAASEVKNAHIEAHDWNDKEHEQALSSQEERIRREIKKLSFASKETHSEFAEGYREAISDVLTAIKL